MTVEETAEFEAERPVLTAIAYRMLGEKSAAEDIVQEAWLRWHGTERAKVENPSAWLKTVTTRLAIDNLRSAHKRREVHVGPWLPEPLIEVTEEGPEAAFILAQECELALLWAMERLAPSERAAFILREAFDADYTEIAETLGKSESACRQLVSRAGKRVKDVLPRFSAPSYEVQDLLVKFAQATLISDRQVVMELLAPDAIAVSDGGGKARAALRVLTGPDEIAHVLITIAGKAALPESLQLVQANRQPAFLLRTGDGNDMLYTLVPDANRKVRWIYIMRNPDKLPAENITTLRNFS